jgi:hypothetical protein
MDYISPARPAGMVQILRRPITDQEQSLAIAYFGAMQKAARALAGASVLLMVLNIMVMLGAFPIPEMAILFAVLALVVGLIAIGIGAMTIKIRGRIDAALKEGAVMEIRAPAYRAQTSRKAPSWTIGPITIMQTPELQTLLVEGAPTTVVCIPGVNAALSVNGMPLRRGASITTPPNLAAMAANQAPYPMEPFPPQPVQYQQAPPQYPAAQQGLVSQSPQQPYPPQMQPYPPQQPPFPPQPQPYPPQQQFPPQPQPYPPQQPPFPPQQQAYPPQQQFPPQPQPYPGQQQPYPAQPPQNPPRK